MIVQNKSGKKAILAALADDEEVIEILVPKSVKPIIPKSVKGIIGEKHTSYTTAYRKALHILLTYHLERDGKR